MNISAKNFKRLLNCWPPFWGAGIRVLKVSEDFSHVRVSLALRWYNKNYMRVQYGGSLFSMTDPFFALMLIKRLGKGYVVWDKHGAIDYIRPGKSHVYADFCLTEEQVESIRADVKEQGKVLPVFSVTIHDENNEVVAKVTKTLYVRAVKADD